MLFIQETDLKRIVPINCGYIDGFEMVFEKEDRRFLVDVSVLSYDECNSYCVFNFI